MRQVLGVVPAVCVAKRSESVADLPIIPVYGLPILPVCTPGKSPRTYASKRPRPAISRRSSIAVSPEAAKSAILFLMWFCPESAVQAG